MATVDGRPAQYGLSLKQLRELMETRGREGVNKVSGYGGVQEICKKLYTSPSEGKSYFCFLKLYSIAVNFIAKSFDVFFEVRFAQA